MSGSLEHVRGQVQGQVSAERAGASQRGVGRGVIAAALTALALFSAACAPQTVAERPTAAQSRVAPGPDLQREPPRPVPPPPTVSPLPPAPPVVEAPPVLRRPAAMPEGGVRVGLLLPLTGSAAELGRQMLSAAEMALFDFGTEHLVLVPRDTEVAGAAAAARSALEEGAQILLGPIFAQAVQQAAPVARAAGVPLIAFSSDRTVAAPGAWVLGLPPGDAIDRAVQQARRDNRERFAALVPQSPLGEQVADALRQSVERHGGRVVRIDSYPAATNDFTQVVRSIANFDSRRSGVGSQLRALEGRTDEAARRERRRIQGQAAVGDPGYDTLVLAESGARLRLLAPMLAFFDIDQPTVRVLGLPLWEDPGLGREPALVGSWFAAPDPAGRQDFERRFREVSGAAPLRIATLAYDATGLAAVLARQPGGPDFSLETLTQPDGFLGVDGLFRLLPSGHVERGLAVLQIERTGLRILDPAPQRFLPPQTN
ncbi:MAG: penicillin-binding protein activator [Alphaproteobacteria bacterium]|nr:penicillin-binding protein activator [Alphaproteobacteria bacterium]TAD86890.1 MAG: penicillin-binding protein activator [Alphaproteobacteria bacterium]